MKEKITPLVSVIMSVYNTEEHFLRGAIDSMLAQTYKNIEFIIVDDASKPQCRKVLLSYQDKRIQILTNERNIGLTESLNRALDVCKGDYIARMDSDDVNLPDRIEKQVKYLETHGDIDVLACVTCVYDSTENLRFAGGYRQFEQERIRIKLSLDNIEFTHPTVMFRTSFLRKNSMRYDNAMKKAQDYNMWVRCIEIGKLFVMQEPLFVSRIHSDQIGQKHFGEQQKYADMTKTLCLKRLLSDYTEEQRNIYVHFRDVSLCGSIDDNYDLLCELLKQNKIKRVYDIKQYEEEMLFWWFRKALNQKDKKMCIHMLKKVISRMIFWRIIWKQLTVYAQDMLYLHRMKKKWYNKMQYGEWRQWI